MPNVPYTGVPSVEPELNPTPRVSANTPTAAFGGATAEALTQLGSAFSQDGNELWQRAEAMQQLKNHSEAQEAASQYMEQAGKLHADFSALQGKDAVNAYPAYIDNLKAARKSIQDGMSNPESQKMYEGESLSTQGRTIFNGAGHAASENKSYAIGAAAGRVAAERNAALVDPTDEKGFQQHLTSTVNQTTAQWQLKGADDDTISAAVHKATSDLWYDRIAGLARSQPFTASKLLDKATSDGKINGEDIGKLTSIVRDATHTVGARNIAHEVQSGTDLSWGAKPVSIASAKVAIGTFESGNNYQSYGPNTSHGRALGRYQVMEEFLPDFLKQAGMPAMSSKDFINSPSAQDKLFETVFGKYMSDTGSFNDAASKWLTGKTMAEAGNVADRNGTTAAKYVAATNAVLAKNAQLPDQIAAGRTRADQMFPNDPLAADYVEQRMISDHNMTVAAKRDAQYQTRQTVETGLITGGRDGKLPTSPDMLKAQGPEVEAAWQQLDPASKMKYMNVMARNAKGDVTMTEDRLRSYQQLRGLAQTDPKAFLETDVISQDLPMSTRKELVGLQAQMSKNADADPRVLHALSILKPTLDSAQLTRSNNADDYDRFVGSLQLQMEQFQNDNKTPPKAKDIQEIGQRLLQNQVTDKGWIWNTKEQTYNLSVPDAMKQKIVSSFKSDHGIEPTDSMVQTIYSGLMYQKLYGKKGGTP